jgi:hypothetical protein
LTVFGFNGNVLETREGDTALGVNESFCSLSTQRWQTKTLAWSVYHRD